MTANYALNSASRDYRYAFGRLPLIISPLLPQNASRLKNLDFSMISCGGVRRRTGRTPSNPTRESVYRKEQIFR